MKFRNPFKAVPIKAYWWRERPNFGDALAPLLLEHFGIKVEWDTVSHSKIASVGSILEHIPPLWDGYIVGSGKMRETSLLHLHTNTMKILAVRGPYSASNIPNISIRNNVALGDPGLLAPELVGPQEKQWDLGIVPHWQDDELAARFTALIKPPHTIKVIDPTGDPLTVIRQIGASRRIVTSSLHGMIVADAFGGIPRRVEICKGMMKDGGDFKFRDYCASIYCPWEAGKMWEPSRFRVEDAQYAIYDAYQALKKAVLK